MIPFAGTGTRSKNPASGRTVVIHFMRIAYGKGHKSSMIKTNQEVQYGI